MDMDIFCKPKGADRIHRVFFSKNNLTPFVIPFKEPSSSRIPRLREGLNDLKATVEVKTTRNTSELQTLQQICLCFVSRFAECIDSLVGFPLGEQLWSHCVEHNEKLMVSGNASRAIIELFEEAFEEEMLQSCKLSQILVINNYEQELLILLRHCRKLDLTGAKLHHNHDLIIALPTGCPYLTHLSVAENNLETSILRILFGIPSLGTPSFQSLEYFYVSGNPLISVQGLERYVLKRELIDLKVVIFDVRNESLLNIYGWDRGPLKNKETITTSGMATDLLNKWDKRFSNDLILKNRKNDGRTTKFYGTKEARIIPSDGRNVKPNEELIEVCLVRKSEIVHQPPKKKPRLQRHEQNRRIDIDEEDSILALYAMSS